MSLNLTVAARWMIPLLICVACSPAEGDRSPTTGGSATETAMGAADANPVGTAEDVAPGVGTATSEDGQGPGPGASAAPASSGSAPAPACVPPEGQLAVDASLEGREGDYRLTMVQQVDGTSTRTAEGALALLTQVDSLRQFQGNAGGAIPGVSSPLFGSTDVNIESVGAVLVGNLSSQDPASPGVLVIESETGSGPSILLRLGSDANRRDLVRFDGGYAVLNVEEITVESFGGTWSSGALGLESEGFFCARQSG